MAGEMGKGALASLLRAVREVHGRSLIDIAGQTHGELLHWHPHLHLLVTCGAFTPAGEFLERKEFDLARLEVAWQEAVFALYLAEDKITAEVVENMRSWQHSGFSVDPSVRVPAGDQAGIERLVGYMTCCPFSVSRLVKVTNTGQVIYKGEKSACRSFPEARGDGLQAGPKRNYQILSPLDFLAEFTEHIPAEGSHLVRYYGWYSNKSRGLRKQASAVEKSAPAVGADAESQGRCSPSWAMLIKRVYEVDPLSCPECGGQMKVITFVEPPQADVIEKLLKHCGFWQASSARPPPTGVADARGDPHGGVCYTTVVPRELTSVDQDTFEATF